MVRLGDRSCRSASSTIPILGLRRTAKPDHPRPPKTTDEHVGFNGKVALILTTTVGTMWCAYAFGVLALVALPQALGGGLLPLIQWVSQTFIQLVMLSVIMVGHNILSRASDKRADMTYQDAEATFHEAQEIQAHLKAQDDAVERPAGQDRDARGGARSGVTGAWIRPRTLAEPAIRRPGRSGDTATPHCARIRP
jgi:hypothetical protein